MKVDEWNPFLIIIINISLDSASVCNYLISTFFMDWSTLPGGGGGGLSYKSHGGARQIFWKWLLKGTKILFYGRGPKLILPLRGTKIKHYQSCS